MLVKVLLALISVSAVQLTSAAALPNAHALAEIEADTAEASVLPHRNASVRASAVIYHGYSSKTVLTGSAPACGWTEAHCDTNECCKSGTADEITDDGWACARWVAMAYSAPDIPTICSHANDCFPAEGLSYEEACCVVANSPCNSLLSGSGGGKCVCNRKAPEPQPSIAVKTLEGVWIVVSMGNEKIEFKKETITQSEEIKKNSDEVATKIGSTLSVSMGGASLSAEASRQVATAVSIEFRTTVKVTEGVVCSPAKCATKVWQWQTNIMTNKGSASTSSCTHICSEEIPKCAPDYCKGGTCQTCLSGMRK